MTTKIELTTIATDASQGCGDNCGCSTAKAKEVVAPLATAAVSPVAGDCGCLSGGTCSCGDNCTCGTGCC